MTVVDQGAAPVAAKKRIASLDALRGIALLGILPMNIQAFSMIAAAYVNPTAYGDLHRGNYWVWYLSHLLADEKFLTIFSMLFGAGIYLMTGNVEASGTRPGPLHYRRMGWLSLFGLLHGYLLWYGDILLTYSLCGMLLFVFRKMAPRRLIVLGTLLIAVCPLLLLSMGWSIPHWPQQKVQELREQTWQPTPAEVQDEITAYRSGWLGEMPHRFRDNTAMQVQAFLLLSFWRVEGCMLIGVALFKLGVFSAKRSANFYWTCIALAIVVGVPLIIYGTERDFAAAWSMRDSMFFNILYNYWASILVALGWVGAVMLLYQSAALHALLKPVAAVGRMAFTNYILHTLICTTLFYGFGFGLYGKLSRVQQFEVVLAIWTFQLIVSPIWLRYFRFGPLEWLWRSLTYWKPQPFRAASSATG